MATKVGASLRSKVFFCLAIFAGNQLIQLEALSPDGVALLEFKATLQSATLLLPTWNASDASPCHWEGVGCASNTSFVDSLSLTNLNAPYEGAFSPSLGRLQFLRALELEVGYLRGEIPPELANCTRLEILNLMNNELSGSIPAQLGNLSALTTLLLSANSLVGDIPITVAAAPSLQILDLSANYLTGRVPRVLYQNQNLQVLNVGGNNFTGNITTDLEELAKLPNIRRIQMNDNNFTGSLPPSLGNCKSLQHLDLGSNNLQGTIPSSIGDCRSLQTLILDTNPELTGQLPSELGKLQNLSTIVIYGTKLHGAIPDSLGNCSSLEYLVLSMNNLTGSIPKTLGHCSALVFLNLANNSLSGDVPQELGNCTNMRVMQLGSNQFAGEWKVDFSRVTSPTLFLSIFNNRFRNVTAFFASIGSNPNFTVVDGGKNDLEGEIPAIFDVRLLSKLQVFMLGYNKLQGPIPDWLWNLPSVRILDISNNNLSGTFASNTNFTNMQGFINTFFSDVLPNYQDLSNYYTEDFSFHLKNLLQGVSMSYLSFFTFLDISTNNLTGSIPGSIGELSNLSYLDLSRNAFTGTIPAGFGRITVLHTLDMSNNLLTGSIPSDFAAFTVLGYFQMGNNSLSGPIPKSTQLRMFGTRSFLPGNDDLCDSDEPFSKLCSVVTTGTNGSTENNPVEIANYNIVERYISIPGLGVGFAVGVVLASIVLLRAFPVRQKQVVPANYGVFRAPA